MKYICFVLSLILSLTTSAIATPTPMTPSISTDFHELVMEEQENIIDDYNFQICWIESDDLISAEVWFQSNGPLEYDAESGTLRFHQSVRDTAGLDTVLLTNVESTTTVVTVYGSVIFDEGHIYLVIWQNDEEYLFIPVAHGSAKFNINDIRRIWENYHDQK